MSRLSEHFDSTEFTCKCGCNKTEVDKALISKLEDMYTYFSKLPTGCKYIIINSGYRCSKHSVAVGGFANDAHTKGIAADITVYRADGVPYIPEVMAAVAEYVGFTGIGVMANNVHVDVRNKSNYVNAHWFGDEVTGDDNISTFRNFLPQLPTEKHKLTVIFDSKTIFEKEF